MNNGDFIHRYIPGQGEGGITLLLLHGTGGNEASMVPMGRALSSDAGLLSPRGRSLENGMPRFFQRFSEGVFNVEDIVLRAHELSKFVGWAANEYGFDPKKVVAVGYSNGANIAAALLLLHPKTLAGAVLFRPIVPLEPDIKPDLSGVPVFIGAAEQDTIVPVKETERLETLLRTAGADVTTYWQPGGHDISTTEIELARKWLSERQMQ